MSRSARNTAYILRFLAWFAFIGFCIDAGAYLFSFIVSLVNPAASAKLYQAYDLSQVRELGFSHYVYLFSLKVSVVVFEAIVAFQVINLISAIDFEEPFTSKVSRILDRISISILGCGLLAITYNGYAQWLSQRISTFEADKISTEFLFMAGVVFVFAQIFRKGVALQTEQNLTV